MKKSWILVLSVLLIVAWTSLSGCSKNVKTGEPTGSESKPTATENQNTPATLADVVKNAQSTAAKGIYMEMNSTVSSSQGEQKSTAKMWLSGSKMRVETEAMGVKTIMITTGSGDMYVYNPATNTAMKTSAAQAGQNEPSGVWSQDAVNTNKVIGKEKVNGQECIVTSSTATSDENKLWTSIETGLPVKAYIKTGGATMTTEYSNVKIGAQPDNLFTLPANAQISTMPAIPGGAQP